MFLSCTDKLELHSIKWLCLAQRTDVFVFCISYIKNICISYIQNICISILFKVFDLKPDFSTLCAHD